MKRPLSTLQWIALVIVGLALLAIAFVCEENWRAEHEWNAYVAAAKAKGVKFEIADFLRKAPIPDEENFAATPLLKPLYPNGEKYSAELSQKLRLSATSWKITSFVNLIAGKRINLTELEKATAPLSLAASLDKQREALDEIEKASHQPYCYFPTDFSDLMATHQYETPVLLALGKLFCIRGVQSLSIGNSDSAMQDWETLMRLAQLETQNPLLLSQLLATHTRSLATQALWEGLLDHRWNDRQLLAAQTHLARVNIFPEVIKSMQMERAMTSQWYTLLANQPSKFPELGTGFPIPSKPVLSTFAIGSKAFFLQNLLTYNRAFDSDITPHLQYDRVISPSKFPSEDAFRNRRHPYEIFATISIAVFPSTIIRLTQNQVMLHEAAVACALERYWLTHGTYPASLSELPGPIPNDVITGKPFIYERRSDGSFLLYSVGWNEIDDHGEVKGNIDRKQGDWVWPTAAKP